MLMSVLITQFLCSFFVGRLWTMALSVIFLFFSLNSFHTVVYESAYLAKEGFSISLMILTMVVIFSILHTCEHKNIFSMMILCCMVLCLTTNFLVFFFAYESLVVFLFLYIMLTGNSPERIKASMWTLLYLIIISLPFLCLLLHVNYSLSSSDFMFMSYYLQYTLMFSLFLGLFLVKIPVFFLHGWLPKAHVHASTEGSILLAAVLLKMGFLGLYKFMPLLLPAPNNISFWVMTVSLLGGMMASYMTMKQTDMKAYIAYSSIVYMSMAVCGLMTYTKIGMVSGFLMCLGHGLSSGMLFLFVGKFHKTTGSRSFFMSTDLMVTSMCLFLLMLLGIFFNMGGPGSLVLIAELLCISSVSLLYSMVMVPLLMIMFFSFVYNLYFYQLVAKGASVLFNIKSYNNFSLLWSTSVLLTLAGFIMMMNMVIY